MTPATPPMAIASIGWTKPEAGVMATRPATAPAGAPLTLGVAPRPPRAAPLAEEEGGGQGGGARVDVDRRATGEVQGVNAARVQYPQPARTEDPVRNRIVHQERPQQHEYQDRAELGPLREGAGDEGG